jgi:hypothetical protein
VFDAALSDDARAPLAAGAALRLRRGFLREIDIDGS